MVERFGIYWVDFNPTKGSEINKIRPAVVVSPATDQIRTVDKLRIGKQAGVLNEDERESLIDVLEEMFIL